MKRIQILGSIVSVLVLCMPGGAFSASGQNTLTLNVGGATHTISKALYGVLMENYGRCIYGGVFVGNSSPIPNTKGIRNDVIDGFREAGIGCIEWPGGCFADKYHWQDGIGEQSSRPGGERENGLGTPEFFMLCSLVNAYAYPTANIQSGSSAEMNAWLTYIHDRPSWWSIMPFWKIGNEEWDPCGNMTQSQYQTKFDQWYEAEPQWAKSGVMHIMDGGPGGGWVNADASYAAGKNGPMGISYHMYAVTDWNNKGPSSGFSEAQYYTQLQKAWAMDNNVKNFNIPEKVALCVDEWGAWYNAVSGLGTDFNWSTVRDAIIAGMNLNIFNNRCDRVKMALVAQPVNVIQSLMVTENSGDRRLRKTPVFWVFKMYKPHQQAKMVPAAMTTSNNQGVPILTASASIDSAKSLHISIVNTHATADQNLTINLTNMPSGLSYETNDWRGEIVNGKSITSGITSFTATDTASLEPFSDFKVSGTSITAKLPAHSVVMLTAAKPTGAAVPTAASKVADAYSITASEGGKITINCMVNRPMAMRCTLYGIDGRMIVEPSGWTLAAGSNTVVWKPVGRRDMVANAYIVKLETGSVVLSQRIVMAR